MIRLMNVAVLTLALSLAGCGSGTSEAPKASDAAKPAATGCKCGDKQQGSRPDCACKDKPKADGAGCKCGDKPQGSRPDCACKDKPKADGAGCKSCEKSCAKAGTADCPAAGSGETKTPAAEKK